MRAKHFLVADTETTGLGSKAIVFDLAYVIATRKKTILERSFLIEEIITNPQIMLGALDDKYWRQSFGGKLFHHYIPELDQNKIRLHKWRDIVGTMRDDMHTYNVNVFAAFNLRFDMGALAKTQIKICETGKVLDYKPDLLCLWEFACNTVCRSQLYHDIARERGQDSGWITPANNVRTNAEKVYAYLTGNFDHIESHTALQDAREETEILQRLLAKKTPIPYNVIDHMPWRKAQKLWGNMHDNMV
jgi:hypothetical protein